MNYEWNLRYSYVPEVIEKNNKKTLIKKNLESLELELNNDTEELPSYKMILYSGKKDEEIKSAKIINKSSKKVPSTKLSFLKLRDFIKTHYGGEYKWDKLVIENKCVSKPKADSKGSGSASDIQLNASQKFISNFFCPESPYKGLLLWHSVGTGKTCTGVATATTSFEKQGYNILWVTRTTLKSDVWKNIFDQICHTIILEEVKKGLLIPEKISDRKKLLSQSWLEPMSYKQFSNLLAGKNKIYDILLERNGKTDILKKTLIIIDEAHKLYGGDLKASEKPDVKIMEKLIMNSYEKSGADSCKLLVMTATPFTNSPLELFSLINLFITDDSEKITTNKVEFIKQYMNESNLLSENGVKTLANKMAGYISYLNREKDPTQFAQPIMINVPILMSHIDNTLIRDMLYLNEKIEDIKENLSDLIKKTREKLRNVKEEFNYKNTIFKHYQGKGPNICSEKFKTDNNKYNKCIQDFDNEVKIFAGDIGSLSDQIRLLTSELERLTDNNDENKEIKKAKKAFLKDLKDKLKLLKDSIVQEYMLYKKCGFLKYKNYEKPVYPQPKPKQTSNTKTKKKDKDKNKLSPFTKKSNITKLKLSPITKKNILERLITINGHGGKTTTKIKLPEHIYIMIPHENGTAEPYTTPDANKDILFEEKLYSKGYFNYIGGWKLYQPGDMIDDMIFTPFTGGNTNSCENVLANHKLQKELAKICINDNAFNSYCPLYCTKKVGDNFELIKFNKKNKLKIKTCSRFKLSDLFTNLLTSLKKIPHDFKRTIPNRNRFNYSQCD